MSNYIATIGLEIHVQPKTKSKMFCSCVNDSSADTNENTCPVCLGLPGALPMPNEEAINLTVLTGTMLGCEIPEWSRFDRKNYFYPDVPNNFQLSQLEHPLCLGGKIPLHISAYPKDAQKSIRTPDKKIILNRIHLEEDVAKSTHFETNTGVDFNRAGMALMEIVTEPDIESPEEAYACLSALREILIYGNVSDADMEKGQMRCDCNVSVRPEGQDELGTKVEIKNMNSISGVRRALAYEIRRQIELLSGGGRIQQQTRRWDDEVGETFLMRVKETVDDYRYFPDPDLSPIKTTPFKEEAVRRLPELPSAKRKRLAEQYRLTEYDADVLASDRSLADYFESAARGIAKPKTVANWIINDLLSALSASDKNLADCKIPAEDIGNLAQLIEEGKINGKQAKEVFELMFAEGKSAQVIVKERGFEQVSDTGAIEALADQVIAANPKPVADYKSGNEASLNFLKGQIMKLSKGQANPKLAGEILIQKLK